MESQLFCYFSWWCATRNIERVYQESRKAVLEGRGLCPVFSVNTGKLEVGKVSFNSEQLFQPNNHKTISFYENEDEFSDNLGEFLENPPAIRTLFPMFKIRNYKVTLANANPQIYSQNADTVESIFI
ncbi:hypothetical protein RI030_05805 [Aphanizomenon flos-aquae NRERC-008]|jgi:hypothetical protein|uniref:Uncharacterized protein n=3 Tax=Aphanizomenonaceae TaxID=1892259 RepID=A0A1B7WIF5_APHFL|nr:hypothetical protein [Aphanizomenon flos-aquae]OBQ36898.1 MAG: hypothetical protein AN484_25400 [Aphanizomenon flos-aquae WA102]QSV65500.1 MAG: hypothetical protein HEQ12_08355 [Aphanizomenon flos-aquae DEX188]MBD2389903.1 hypothetical protein [Aphanizomenon flos-aquae FACHB-1171]MBD2558179.1 hypothetical protein [Aphanizomenon flos-aquae FACHB-1290]MDS9397120.1 hypothetical protein [Aphanizomenon flos-aquae NRERC-008]